MEIIATILLLCMAWQSVLTVYWPWEREYWGMDSKDNVDWDDDGE